MTESIQKKRKQEIATATYKRDAARRKEREEQAKIDRLQKQRRLLRRDGMAMFEK